MFLATDIENHIVCTDLCKKLANDTSELNSDDYLLNFAKKFYYPSPIFEDYDINSPQIFPVVATIKFLFANYLKKKDFVSVNEVRDYLIGNNEMLFGYLVYIWRLNLARIDISDLFGLKPYPFFNSCFTQNLPLFA